MSVRWCVKLEWMRGTTHHEHKAEQFFIDIPAPALPGHLGIQYSVMSALQYTSCYVEQWPTSIVHDMGHTVEERHSQTTTESTLGLLSVAHSIVGAALQSRKGITVQFARGARHPGRIYGTTWSILRWWHEDVGHYHLFDTMHGGRVPKQTYDPEQMLCRHVRRMC